MLGGFKMKKKLLVLFSILFLMVLVACGGGDEEAENDDNHDSNNHEVDSLTPLEVDFQVPHHVDVNETVELIAVVTFGDDVVTDADEVVFEYWLQDQRDETSEMVDGVNNGDGSYSAEITFDSEGIYEMFAHTTARDQHVMPLKSIGVGEGYEDHAPSDDVDHDHDHDHDDDHDDEE